LPLPDPRRVFDISEIVLVLRLGQPGLLAGLFAGFLAVGFGTEALTLFASVVGNKQFVAVEALALMAGILHRFPKSKEGSVRKIRTETEENPTEEKLEQRRRKKKFQ
jgi:hypothetical protein